MKDPAFLFYSNDFYGGTRTMLPEERACYIDLMIYQHQNGYIPTDLRRVLLFCSGVSEATLKAVLEAKFKLSDKGWYNERLQNEMCSREEFAKNRSVMGSIGQFWKKAKAYFSSQKEYQKYRKRFSGVDTDTLYTLINSQEIKGLDTPKAMLEAMLKHIENEDENENENTQEDIEGGVGETGSAADAEIIDPADFENVWAMYGKKGNKKTSAARWARLPNKAKALALGHIPRYVLSTPSITFRKNFETYINQEAWNDEIITDHDQRTKNTGTAPFADEEFFRSVANGIQRGQSSRHERGNGD